MKKKCAFFVTSLQSGGIENYLLRFLQYKHQKLCQVTVFCKRGFGGQLEEQYKAIPNITIVKRKLSFFNIFAYFSLIRYLRYNNFDVVCDFTGNFSGLVLWAASKAEVKTRISFYRSSRNRFHANYLKSIYNKWMKNLVYKHSTSILSNSKAAFNYFYPNKWQKDSRFEVIYNGVNTNTFTNFTTNLRTELSIPEQAFVVGHTGRYNSAKNHETILKVAENLVNRYSDIYFILSGNQVASNLLRKLEKRGLSERIKVFDNRTDIPQFLNTMDCYYFPSLTEGQPNALIEAMVMNIPIVASNIEPIKETVPSQYFSFLVDPLDSEQAEEKILEIRAKGNMQHLQAWAIENYQAEKLFNQFFNHF